MGNVVTLTGSGGQGGFTTGGTTGNWQIGPSVQFGAQQIAGLVKMIPCGFKDCRETDQVWWYHLPVFGNGYKQAPSYINDANTFLINFSGQGTPKFTLQKATCSIFDGKEEPWGWTTIVDDLSLSDEAIVSGLGSIVGYPSYTLCQINWGTVLTGHGSGYYRILFQSCLTTTTGGGEGKQQASLSNNSQSIPTPYSELNSNSWWPQVQKVSVDFSIQCGATLYTVPTFWVSPNNVNEQSQIVTTLNNWFIANNSPFVASALYTDHFDITGTQYAAQNGCQVFCNYNAYKIVSTSLTQLGGIEIGPGLMTGGNNGSSGTTTTICTCGLQTPVFRLWQWDCAKAHGTVKFECWNGGTLGDINNDGALFGLCGLSLYDSVRFGGKLGYSQATYESLVYEWGISSEALFGINNISRDKMIPTYTLKTRFLPTWLHNQLKNVMMMADCILASDYNIDNSDWNIQRKTIMKKGGYEIDYKDAKGFPLNRTNFSRLDMAKVEFVAAVQSVIKSTCCISV